MIRVLLVDDSVVSRMHVQRILEATSDLQVAGVARDGAEAIEAVKTLKPDVIAMDLEMPGIDGYQATRAIMETTPTPIVVVCGLSDVTARQVTLRALEAGAVAVLERPPSHQHRDYAKSCAELCDTLRTSSEVRLVRRWRPKGASDPISAPVTPSLLSPTTTLVRPAGQALTDKAVVAIGASTGGPVALLELLRELPPSFPLPICVVQHIAAGFVESLATWLDGAVPLEVKVAEAGQRLAPGRVYLAPHGTHMTLGGGPVTRAHQPVRSDSVLLHEGALEYGMCPAVSQLFRSVAVGYGSQAVGVLLTGMGADGAAELGVMRQVGATTFAQDNATSLVFGMPGEAVRLGAAEHVLSPRAIAGQLLRLTAHLTPGPRR